jgi:hypothetical protein
VPNIASFARLSAFRLQSRGGAAAAAGSGRGFGLAVARAMPTPSPVVRETSPQSSPQAVTPHAAASPETTTPAPTPTPAAFTPRPSHTPVMAGVPNSFGLRAQGRAMAAKADSATRPSAVLGGVERLKLFARPATAPLLPLLSSPPKPLHFNARPAAAARGWSTLTTPLVTDVAAVASGAGDCSDSTAVPPSGDVDAGAVVGIAAHAAVVMGSDSAVNGDVREATSPGDDAVVPPTSPIAFDQAPTPLFDGGSYSSAGTPATWAAAGIQALGVQDESPFGVSASVCAFEYSPERILGIAAAAGADDAAAAAVGAEGSGDGDGGGGGGGGGSGRMDIVWGAHTGADSRWSVDNDHESDDGDADGMAARREPTRRDDVAHRDKRARRGHYGELHDVENATRVTPLAMPLPSNAALRANVRQLLAEHAGVGVHRAPLAGRVQAFHPPSPFEYEPL